MHLPGCRRRGRIHQTTAFLCSTILVLFASTTIYVVVCMLYYHTNLMFDLRVSLPSDGDSIWEVAEPLIFWNLIGSTGNDALIKKISLQACASAGTLTVNVCCSRAVFIRYTKLLLTWIFSGHTRWCNCMLESMCRLAQKQTCTSCLRRLIIGHIQWVIMFTDLYLCMGTYNIGSSFRSYRCPPELFVSVAVRGRYHWPRYPWNFIWGNLYWSRYLCSVPRYKHFRHTSCGL